LGDDDVLDRIRNQDNYIHSLQIENFLTHVEKMSCNRKLWETRAQPPTASAVAHVALRPDHWLSFVSRDWHYHILNKLHPHIDDNEDDRDHLQDPLQPPDKSNPDLVKAGSHPRSPDLRILASRNQDHCRVYDRHYCCL